MQVQVVQLALQSAQTEAQGAETEAVMVVMVAAVLREEQTSSLEQIRKQKR